MEINIGIIAIIVLAIAILAILASGYVKASPNKAYIISGIKREPKVLIGRAGIKIPFLEKKDELILKQISIDIKTNGYIPTKDFIGVDIDAVAKKSPISRRQKLTQHIRSRKRNSVRPWRSPQRMRTWPVRRRNWN